MERAKNIVGASEAKTHFYELLKRVEAGGEIIITKHGAPVAKLVPVKKETTTERAAAVRRIQRLGTSLSLRGLKIRDLMNEGRQ